MIDDHLTYMGELVSDFDSRWNDVDLILHEAEKIEPDDKRMVIYCRILSVLMVANLERYIRDVITAIVRDINKHNYFKNSPIEMKQTYCRKFYPDKDGMDKFIKRLIDKLDECNVQYDVEGFLYDNGKNPKASIIEKRFSSIGGKGFVNLISSPKIEDVFMDDGDFNMSYINFLKKRCTNSCKVFPYQVQIGDINFNFEKTSKKTKSNIWQEFINVTLRDRHNVAHDSGEITAGLIDLKRRKEKIIVLELLFTILCMDLIK